jgi:hypothetical protein
VIEPVDDAVFELPLPLQPSALVVDWPDVASGLRDLGHSVVEASDLGGLAAASVVAIAPEDDAVPPLAMQVLAARRVLVTGPVVVTYGLHPGIDFMHSGAADAAVALANTALVVPEAFVTVRVLGALAAERHRVGSAPA